MQRVHFNHYQHTPLKHGSLKTETKQNQKAEDIPEQNQKQNLQRRNWNPNSIGVVREMVLLYKTNEQNKDTEDITIKI